MKRATLRWTISTPIWGRHIEFSHSTFYFLCFSSLYSFLLHIFSYKSIHLSSGLPMILCWCPLTSVFHVLITISFCLSLHVSYISQSRFSDLMTNVFHTCVIFKQTNFYSPGTIRLIHESAISRGCLVVVPILGSGM